MTAPRDLDRLSAYLDGQLSASEKARLEARLRSEADLREALDGLRRVQTALRGLPVLRVPRNFTLTPAQAGQRTPTTIPTLRWAAALASFAFIFVMVSDLALGLSRSSGAAVTAQDASGAGAERSLATAAAAAAADSSAQPTLAAGVSMMDIAPTETPADFAAKAGATPATAGAAEAATAPPADLGGSAPVAPSSAPTTAPDVVVPTTPTAAAVAEAQAAATEAANLPSLAPQPPASGLPPLRYIEIALGLLAAFLVAAALLMRR